MAEAHIKPNELAAWKVRAKRLADDGRCVECGSAFESKAVKFPSSQLHSPEARQTLCPACRDTSKMPVIPPIQ
jgi:hypothetical protein